MKGRLEHECRSKGGKVHTEEKEEHKAKKRKRGGKVHGGASHHRLDKRAHGGGNWIAGATKNKGALHRALHVPEGEKIPASKLEKAERSSNPTMRKRANLAKTLKKMH